MLNLRRTIVPWLIGLLVVIGLPVACLVVWKSQDGPPAGIVTPASQRVVASPNQGKIIATYRVTNRGRRDLVLGDVRTTCGCSVASVQPKILKPGRSGTITIKGDPPRVGSKTVFAHIATNAPPPGELTIKLTMIGTAPIPYVAVSSGPVRFGIIRSDSPPETIRIETRERSGQTP